ncbi:hypothetical protein JCM6882_006115 [Rhodosporidiobolus microsporus]
MENQTRLPTLQPAYSFNIKDPYTGTRKRGKIVRQMLEAPGPDVVDAAQEEANMSGSQMVALATKGQIEKIFGSSWRQQREKDFRSLLVDRTHLPELITKFVQHIMPALYSEQPHIYQAIEAAVRGYHVNPRLLIVTNAPARTLSFSDVHVPALPLPVLPAQDNSVALAIGSRTRAMAAFPVPLEVMNGEVNEATAALQQLKQGQWSLTHRTNEIDSGRLPEWHLLPPRALKAVWRYEGSQQLAPHRGHFDIAHWRLELTYPNGVINRLRIHFDMRLLQLQNEFEADFHIARQRVPRGTAFAVRARPRGERRAVLNRQQPQQ